MKHKKGILLLVGIILVTVVIVITYFQLYFNKKPSDLEIEAEKIEEIVESNDMIALNELLFGTNALEVDDELIDLFVDDDTESSGVISHILARDEVNLKKIKDEVLVYEISAPDLNYVLQDAEENIEGMTQDNFGNFIFDYIDKAEIIKITVEVSYSYENGEFKADYNSEEFVNGLTGNLLESYQTLIQDVLDEL